MPDVILAGGTGGLGSACVRLLAPEWRVIAGFRSNRERAEKLAGFATIVQADLSVGEDRVRLLDAASDL